MNVRTVARIIGMAAVVWCATVFPQEADAQCAYSYSSTWVVDEYGNNVVYAEAAVGDYYGTIDCGGFYPGFSHEYSILQQITCETQYQESTAYTTAPGGGGSASTNTALVVTVPLECTVTTYMVIYCPLVPGPILEEYAAEYVQVNQCSITVKFSGGLTSGNNLSFAPASYVCGGNTLGFVDCMDDWLNKVEISGNVSDDASLWTARQSVWERRLRILGSNPEDDTIDPKPDDDPSPTFTQKPAGQKKVFWLDAPGHQKIVGPFTVTSLYQVQNFTSKLEKGTRSCSVLWHSKMVVAGGSIFDHRVGLGHLSTSGPGWGN